MLQMAVWMDRRSLSANEDHPVHRMAGEVGSTKRGPHFWVDLLQILPFLFYFLALLCLFIYFVAGDLHVSVSLES